MTRLTRFRLVALVVAVLAALALAFLVTQRTRSADDRASAVTSTPHGPHAATPLTEPTVVRSEDPQAAADEVLEACAEAQACVGERLGGLVHARDAEFALLVLDATSARSAAVLGASHAIAHQIGEATYAKHRDLPGALSECRDNAASGCFHGVMMGVIATDGLPERDVLARTCDAVKGEGGVLHFNCLHGLGHGVMLGRLLQPEGTAGLDEIRRALNDCDALRDDYGRRSCHGGVFMEYLVAASYPIFHYGSRPTYPDGDPHWPCDAVDDRYAASCYELQGRRFLDLTGFDYAAAFRECARAPLAGQATCAENLGREASGQHRRDAAEIRRLCDLTVDGEQRGGCLAGAAREVINYDGDFDSALKYCLEGRGPGDDRCVEAVEFDASTRGKAQGWVRERLGQLRAAAR